MNIKKLALFAGGLVVIAGGLDYALGIYPLASLRGGEGAIGKRDVYRADQPADAAVTPGAAPVAMQATADGAKDGKLPELKDGAFFQLSDGQMYQLNNGQLIHMMNGQMMRLFNGQMLQLQNGQIKLQMNNGQLVQLNNGQMYQLSNGQFFRMSDGQMHQMDSGIGLPDLLYQLDC